jgi:hypothetical protein
MAFLPYVRLVAGGVLYGSQRWSIGMSFSNDGTATPSELNTWLLAQDALIKVWLGGEVKSALWFTGTSYTTLRAYAYDAASSPASALAGITSSGVVGSAGQFGNGQLTTVYSLRSGVGGRSGRGRFYMPASAPDTSTTDGQLASAVVTALSTQFKTYVDAANLLSVGSAPAVLGIAGRDSGQQHLAIGLVIQSKLNTQRRRVDKISSDTVLNTPF